MGLNLLKTNAPDLSANPDMLAFVQNYTDMGFISVLLFVFIGTILTMIVQASAATMAITLIMCANGWISFELGAALVLGENIGTTITANLAALTANTQARRAAMAHLMFNIFGVIWVLILFKPFLSMVDWIISDFMNISEADGVAVSFKLSAFHTCFNVCNVLILIWFVKLIEKQSASLFLKRNRKKSIACNLLLVVCCRQPNFLFCRLVKKSTFLQSASSGCSVWFVICYIRKMRMILINCSAV